MNKFKSILVLSLSLFVLLGSSAADAQTKNKKSKSKKTTKKTKGSSSATSTTSSAPMVAPPPPDFTAVEPPQTDSSGYNTLSVRPVHKSDLMYKMSVWRKLDLSEKCNTPWFSESNQLTKFIIEAVARGELKPYKDDSLVKQMSAEAFNERLLDRSAMADAGGISNAKIYLNPRKLYLLEIKEDLLFDKQRSRSYYDMQTIALILPAKFSGEKGAELPIATFKYKDLVRLLDKIPAAKWYNISNKAEDKRMSDAFDLRLFCSRIIKMANPLDRRVEEEPSLVGNDKAILIASQRLEYEIVANEDELWDY